MCDSGLCNEAANKKFREELIAYFPWYDTDHIENDASNNSSIVARVFLTLVPFLTSRCLAMIGEYTDTHTHTGSNMISYFYFFQNKESRLKVEISGRAVTGLYDQRNTNI
jgi:hypothetical protein